MSDQRSDKRPYQVIHFCFRLKLEPEILGYQIISAVLSRTTNTHIYVPERATSSSIIMAFEDLNDESSDTVFHA